MLRARALKLWGVLPIALAIALFALRACVHVAPLDRLAAMPPAPEDPPGAVVYAGSVWIARGGPVLIGFQSDERAKLTFASQEVEGKGVQKIRVILERGAWPLRFAAPPGARLMWSPVGRRGDMEYLPASSLSPEVPEAATFSHPGTDVADGAIAMALMTILAGSLLMLARRRLAAVPRDAWISIGAVLAVALVVRLIGLGDQGQTWDEDVYWGSGRNYVQNVLALDFADRSWIWNFEHPPVMKLLDGMGALLADGFGPARALSALWISLGCALMVPIGARLASLRVGVLAGLVAALLPPLVAHGQIVGHESPTVLWWTLGVLLALGVHDDAPSTRRLVARLAGVGAVVGIAAASRFVNGLLGPLVILIVLVQAPDARRRQMLAWCWVPVAASLAVFVAVWPRMWGAPLAHLHEAFVKMNVTHAAEPFLGHETTHPPAVYFLVYLAATAPIGVLLAALGGLARAVVQRTRGLAIAAACFVIPLGAALSPVRQDGVRYVMPSVAALALLAALGVDWLATRIKRARAFTALSAALVLYLGITLARIAPFYLDYFGEQVGGPGSVQAHRWFETAWWGEGLGEALAYVNEHAAPNAIVARDCILPNHLAWFREDLWAPVPTNTATADWIVWYAPASFPCHIRSDLHEVFSVERGGAVFAKVYSR